MADKEVSNDPPTAPPSPSVDMEAIAKQRGTWSSRVAFYFAAVSSPSKAKKQTGVLVLLLVDAFALDY